MLGSSLACNRCQEVLPKASFSAKQLKATASARFCIACTKGSGTLLQFFASAPAAESQAARPTQVVHESTMPSPGGNSLIVQMERLSTGGTRHQAQFHRGHSARLTDAERSAKMRARRSLFPEAHTIAKAKHAAAAKQRRGDKEEEQAVQEALRASLLAPEVEETGYSEGTGRVGAGAAAELAANKAAVEALGLPHLTVPYSSAGMVLPQHIKDLMGKTGDPMRMINQATIVDYWAGSVADRRALARWLEDLDISVQVKDDCAQIGPSCGYVAARVVSLWFAAGGAAGYVDTSDAVDQQWIIRGNQELQNGQRGVCYLETQAVYKLADAFFGYVYDDPCPLFEPRRLVMDQISAPPPNPEFPFQSMQWPLTVGSRDWVARKISEALIEYVLSGSKRYQQHLFVMNTDETDKAGRHWISIQIGFQWQYLQCYTSQGHAVYGYCPP